MIETKWFTTIEIRLLMIGKNQCSVGSGIKIGEHPELFMPIVDVMFFNTLVAHSGVSITTSPILPSTVMFIQRLQKIEKLILQNRLDGKACVVESMDFAALYPSVPLENLKHVMTIMVKIVFACIKAQANCSSRDSPIFLLQSLNILIVRKHIG